MEVLYCPKCNLVNEVKIHSTNETYEVRGEKITILANVAVCKRCGEQIFHEELDSKNLDKVYREFRKRRAVLAPEQIKAIRTQYGLSQRALSRLLKLGEITINRYESGSLPSDAHNELLILIEGPINVKKLLDRVGSDLSDKEEENLRKTKLMKLLFYSYFYHFKEHGISISGLRYANLPYGPVVDNYNTLITWLETQQSLILTPTNTENGWEIISTQKELEGVLTKVEIETLEKIEEKFGALTANELSNYSHQEKAYTNTSTGELISYDYAFELKI